MSVSNCLLLLSIVHPILVQCSNNLVTCGSVLKLQHVRTNVRLHSHEVSYGSGSGQQVNPCFVVFYIFCAIYICYSISL